MDIRELQIRVAGWYPGLRRQDRLDINGNWGPRTEQAVRNFQQAQGLVADGIVGPRTEAALNVLHNADGSTLHFDWLNFKAPRDQSSVGKLPTLQIVYNLRVLMWTLEGLRNRLGNVPIYINSGFRSIGYNASIGGAATDSMHMYGLAADISTREKTPRQLVDGMKICGFSGVFIYNGHAHGDLRSIIGRPYVW